jgi:hypothetical protein
MEGIILWKMFCQKSLAYFLKSFLKEEKESHQWSTELFCFLHSHEILVSKVENKNHS